MAKNSFHFPPRKSKTCKFFSRNGVPLDGGCPRYADDCIFIHPEDPEWPVEDRDRRHRRTPSPGYSRRNRLRVGRNKSPSRGRSSSPQSDRVGRGTSVQNSPVLSYHIKSPKSGFASPAAPPPPTSASSVRSSTSSVTAAFIGIGAPLPTGSRSLTQSISQPTPEIPVKSMTTKPPQLTRIDTEIASTGSNSGTWTASAGVAPPRSATFVPSTSRVPAILPEAPGFEVASPLDSIRDDDMDVDTSGLTKKERREKVRREAKMKVWVERIRLLTDAIILSQDRADNAANLAELSSWEGRPGLDLQSDSSDSGTTETVKSLWEAEKAGYERRRDEADSQLTQLLEVIASLDGFTLEDGGNSNTPWEPSRESASVANGTTTASASATQGGIWPISARLFEREAQIDEQYKQMAAYMQELKATAEEISKALGIACSGANGALDGALPVVPVVPHAGNSEEQDGAENEDEDGEPSEMEVEVEKVEYRGGDAMDVDTSQDAGNQRKRRRLDSGASDTDSHPSRQANQRSKSKSDLLAGPNLRDHASQGRRYSPSQYREVEEFVWEKMQHLEGKIAEVHNMVLQQGDALNEGVEEAIANQLADLRRSLGIEEDGNEDEQPDDGIAPKQESEPPEVAVSHEVGEGDAGEEDKAKGATDQGAEVEQPVAEAEQVMDAKDQDQDGMQIEPDAPNDQQKLQQELVPGQEIPQGEEALYPPLALTVPSITQHLAGLEDEVRRANNDIVEIADFLVTLSGKLDDRTERLNRISDGRENAIERFGLNQTRLDSLVRKQEEDQKRMDALEDALKAHLAGRPPSPPLSPPIPPTHVLLEMLEEPLLDALREGVKPVVESFRADVDDKWEKVVEEVCRGVWDKMGKTFVMLDSIEGKLDIANLTSE